jgi:signal transduction histidine kinase
MTTRSLWERVTGSAMLSLPAVACFFVIGLIPVVATVPPGDIGLDERLRWVAVGALAQSVFAIVSLTAGVIVGRRSSSAAGVARVVAVIVAGAARGAVMPWAADWFGLQDPASLWARIFNSAYTTLIWMFALAFVVEAQRRFHRDYRRLFEHDMVVAASSRRDVDLTEALSDVDEQVREWSEPVRRRVDRLRTGGDTAETAVGEAAEAIRDLITEQLRPLSHRLWFADPAQPPRSRIGPVLREAIRGRPLFPPVIVAILTLGMSLGSVVRYGAEVASVTVAVLMAVSLVYVLLSRTPWARSNVQRWNILSLIAYGTTAGVLPSFVGFVVFADGADLPTILTVMLGVPTFALAVGMGRVTFDDRRRLLDVMADDRAVRDAVRRIREREVAAYLHNHVKSQLTASALRMKEAARSEDHAGVQAAAQAAHDVLSRPIPDAIALGWQSPWERVNEVAESWSGIARVDLRLMDQLGRARRDALPEAVIVMLADVLAEAIANAVRSGNASSIIVSGRVDGEALTVCIDDDGGQRESALVGEAATGLGTAWLDTMVHGLWDRRMGPEGCRLTVTIPLGPSISP